MIACQEMELAGLTIPVYSLNTVVVGSGAAGLSCAGRLFREMEAMGVEDPGSEVAVVTEGIGLGTSNNSGSDKQTYYKMGTYGQEADLPGDFADTLISGGCTHADLALVEAANSLRGFYRLVDLGVPFPHDRTGGFVGYKTDHDPRQRGTSAGPWTSRFMVQKLLAELKRLDVTIFNRIHMLAVIPDDKSKTPATCGLLCVDMGRQNDPAHGLMLFNCRNVVMAGGGPGDLYEISVYPKGQMGPYAALFEAGVEAQNLTESQFGLASLDPRWNLSGTYQQVIPRYYSTDVDGKDEQEFLNVWFDSMSTLATNIFLKGYQWPFDHDKVADFGSSLIDILVQNETIHKGRRVFIDFRENPRATEGLESFSLDLLKPVAMEYLRKSGATQNTPIERLAHMNPPSIDLYQQLGVDLRKQPLEVGVCSQHCNGGFAVDTWWESSVRHLFVVGELAGTHGVKRPGGSALNAGQVGSIRAAQRIARIYSEPPSSLKEFLKRAGPVVDQWASQITRIKADEPDALDCVIVRKTIQHRMSASAGMVRSRRGVADALAEAREEWRRMGERGLTQGHGGFVTAMKVRELLLAQLGFLEAILALLERGGGSRGSHLVTDPSGRLPHPDLGDEWRYLPENTELRREILTIAYSRQDNSFKTRIDKPRVRPPMEAWFETAWAEYRDGTVFTRGEDDRPRTTGVD